MTSQWESFYVAEDAGDVGGDVQVTDAYGTAWSRPLPGGLFALVTRNYYGAISDETFNRINGSGADPTETINPEVLECQTEYLVCSDLIDPGGTEVGSDYRYRSQPYARDDARLPARYAARLAPEPTDTEWTDAMPHYDLEESGS